LGLVPTAEANLGSEQVDRLTTAAAEHLDIDRLWRVAVAPPITIPEESAPVSRGMVRARIAVARDRAFTFYYEDSLGLLGLAGAEIATFSPLADEQLPSGTQGIYIGGGFPELFAEELSANEPMMLAVRRARDAGLPIYGECGGLMYLGRTLTDRARKKWPMVGIVPNQSELRSERVTVGYRTVTAIRDTPLMPSGAATMGHEFHYSELSSPVSAESAAYRVAERGGAPEGFADRNVLASYVHLHFGTDRRIPERLVAACSACPPVS
jgi:cobyrinic acid a,c-diamide synthase